ncbi:MAG TPA: alpha/beta hydrolase [Anaerolineae bacterium]|nr:alpha/beta hydrolase [Anaerolineae bacterium]
MPLPTVRSSFVSHQKLRFHYLSWTTNEAGSPIVLIHGLGSNAQVWRMVASRLVQAGLRPLAFDLRGHGQSSKPSTGYDIKTMADDLRGLVKNCLLEGPVLVGHSYGAMVALDYASRYTEGSEAPVGIVLIDGGMAQLDAFPGASWEGVQQVLTPPKHEGASVENFLAYLGSEERKWRPDEQAIEAILANYEITEDKTLKAHLPSERYTQAIESLWKFQTYACFDQLRCPVLMLPVTPINPPNFEERIHLELKKDAIQRARATIQDLHVSWLEDTVHDVLLHKPHEIAQEIIAFAGS